MADNREGLHFVLQVHAVGSTWPSQIHHPPVKACDCSSHELRLHHSSQCIRSPVSCCVVCLCLAEVSAQHMVYHRQHPFHCMSDPSANLWVSCMMLLWFVVLDEVDTCSRATNSTPRDTKRMHQQYPNNQHTPHLSLGSKISHSQCMSPNSANPSHQ